MYWRLTQPFISGDVGDDQRMSCSMLAPAWQFDPNRFLSSLHWLSTGDCGVCQATTHCTLALLPHIILGGWLIFANFPRFLSKLTRKHNLRHLHHRVCLNYRHLITRWAESRLRDPGTCGDLTLEIDHWSAPNIFTEFFDVSPESRGKKWWCLASHLYLSHSNKTINLKFPITVHMLFIPGVDINM